MLDRYHISVRPRFPPGGGRGGHGEAGDLQRDLANLPKRSSQQDGWVELETKVHTKVRVITEEKALLESFYVIEKSSRTFVASSSATVSGRTDD